MGAGRRIACIFTPWALTVASFVCLVLVEISGWNPSLLGNYYFFEANFDNLTLSPTQSSDSSFSLNPNLTTALTQAKSHASIANEYEIHLWNYCWGNSTDGKIDFCSGRHKDYYFNPIDVWGLNLTNATSTSSAPTPTSTDGQPISSIEAIAGARLKNDTSQLYSDILGKAGRDALDTYRDVSKWMFIAYTIAFWTTLATIVISIGAIFSRIGSFLTWILAFVSSAFTFAAVLTSTILFSVLVTGLRHELKPYGVTLTLGHNALILTWLGVAFSWAGTLFWLFSVCCCSGRDNPHHRNNKGGLWKAEPKGQGYGNYGGGQGRGLRVEKTGGGYERVGSPYLGHAEDEHGDRVPLQPYAQPMQGAHHHPGHEESGSYEPFRQS